MLHSDDLKTIQDVLKKSIKASLDRPDTDFDKVKELVCVMERVDSARRETWHKEKFGAYEKIADDMGITDENIRDFAADDIPF